MTGKFNYLKANFTAQVLINKFGGNGSLVMPGNNGGYDAFGQPTGSTPPVTINGLITPVLQFKKDEINGETILRTDGFIFFDANADEEIKIGMNTIINGIKYAVVDILLRIESLDGVTVLNKLQVRG